MGKVDGMDTRANTGVRPYLRWRLFEILDAPVGEGGLLFVL